MNRCDACMKLPLHPDKKCCFSCARSSSDCEVWHNCGQDCPGWETRIKTNADRIRGMSDEELAEFISMKYPCHMCTIGAKRNNREDEPCNPEWCIEGIVKWLRQPAQPTPDVPDTHEHSGLLEE